MDAPGRLAKGDAGPRMIENATAAGGGQSAFCPAASAAYGTQ